jgi:hypothetical protein
MVSAALCFGNRTFGSLAQGSLFWVTYRLTGHLAAVSAAEGEAAETAGKGT